MTSLQRLVQLIEASTGNIVPEREHARLGRFIASRIRSGDFEDLDGYVQYLRMQPDDEEWRGILSAVTIKESYLYRGRQQFRAIAEGVLPDLTNRAADERVLRAWSAGCARGDEPATLAAVMADSVHLEGWDWQIVATDIDEVALEAAGRSRFAQRAVSQAPDAILQSCFRKAGPDYVLNEEIRRRITFRRLNLVERELPFPPAHFDIILLRNVLIYFSLEVQTRVVSQVSRLLKPGGYLFLGSTESLLQVDVDLLPMDHQDCFSYRHRQTSEAEDDVRSKHRLGRARASTAPNASEPSETKHNRSAGDVDEIAAAGRPQPTQTTARLPVPFQEIDEAVSSGDRRAALNLVISARAARPSDPALRAAEGWLLQRGERIEEAIHAYRAALYLEPDLYQIRHQMALCLDELGARRRAVNEYREAADRARRSSRRTLDLPGCFELPTRQAVIEMGERLDSLTE